MARGRRRRLRGDRLLPVLRPPCGRLVPAPAAGPLRRRVEPAVAPAARRGVDHQPLELPAGDLLRHDHGRTGRRQHGRGEAVEANPRHRPGDVRDPVAGGRAGRRAALPARLRPRAGRRAGPRSARGDDRLHRLEGGRARHPPRGRRHARGPDVREEGRLRDGRQKRHHRRRFGRSGRGRARRAAIGIRLLRAEVLGVQPGDRPGRRLRASSSSGWWNRLARW